MTITKMGKLNKKDQSQLDLGGVLRSAHQDENHALRVTSANTSVPPSYSRVDVTYNAQGSVTNAKFYEGLLPQVTSCITIGDTLSNLNNKYWILYSENDESKYHVWYNVSSLGVDPAPAGSVGIEVPIEANDAAAIVALATQMAVNNIEDFDAAVNGNKISISTTRMGESTTASDFDTGFTISTVQLGEERLLKSIDIPYDGTVRYIYNTQERKFVVESVTGTTVNIDADAGANIAISRHENPREILESASKADTDLSLTTYTNIFTYTATEELRARVIKINADTMGRFRLKVNGTIKDYFMTSSLQRNCKFEFIEDLDIPNTQDIEVEFIPDRLQELTTYDFFMRIEAYVD